MSDFDDELEDDFNEGPAVDDVADDFADPQQSTAALTKEINKLRQKNEGLRQYNVRQKDRYKDEVRSFLSPLIQKYKDIQNENEFLKRQIKEISQNTASLSLAKQNGENGGNGEHYEDNPLRLMENTIEEKEREISVLNKMVKSLEEESNSIKRDMAELPELKENVKTKNDKIANLEDEKFDLSSKIEAKDSMISKYLNQVNELETNVYVLNKRLSERVGQIENGKVSEQLQKANKQINQLNEKIDHLERQLSDYQDTMNSLEEELDEDNFMKTAVDSASSLSGIDLDKEENHLEDEELEAMDMDEDIDIADEEILSAPSYDYAQLYDEKTSSDNEDLPSDDELLAHDIDDIELEEMPQSSYEDNEENSYDDSEISIDDLPVDEDILSEFDDIDDSEISLDELEDMDLDLDEDDDLDLNPLSQFESSDEAMDEDRDISKLLKKEAK